MSFFLLNLKAKGRESGRSCPSAVPQKALDPSLGARSALLNKWARGSISLFNFSFSLKEFREVMLISQPVLSAPPLDSSLMATNQFPASDFLSALRVDLKLTLVPVLQRGWQENFSSVSSDTLFCTCAAILQTYFCFCCSKPISLTAQWRHFLLLSLLSLT